MKKERERERERREREREREEERRRRREREREVDWRKRDSGWRSRTNDNDKCQSPPKSLKLSKASFLQEEKKRKERKKEKNNLSFPRRVTVFLISLVRSSNPLSLSLSLEQPLRVQVEL